MKSFDDTPRFPDVPKVFALAFWDASTYRPRTQLLRLLCEAPSECLKRSFSLSEIGRERERKLRYRRPKVAPRPKKVAPYVFEQESGLVPVAAAPGLFGLTQLLCGPCPFLCLGALLTLFFFFSCLGSPNCNTNQDRGVELRSTRGTGMVPLGWCGTRNQSQERPGA